MGSRGRGMQTNVALALGYTAPSRSMAESVTCACGGAVVFETDTIGRLVQRCPSGRCFRGIQTVSGDPIAVEVLKVKAATNAANGGTRPEIRTPFPHRNCEFVECAKDFKPRTVTQRYCSVGCASRATVDTKMETRRKTLARKGRS